MSDGVEEIRNEIIRGFIKDEATNKAIVKHLSENVLSLQGTLASVKKTLRYYQDNHSDMAIAICKAHGGVHMTEVTEAHVLPSRKESELS